VPVNVVKAVPDLQALLSAFPKEFVEISPREQGVALALYRLLAMGQPVSHQQLAEACAATLPEVDRLLKTWIAIYYDELGNITGFWGLTLNETPHKLLTDGRELYAWCAWDTLFLPALIGKAVEVISHCASSDVTIQLSINQKHIVSLTPANAVLSFVMPDEEGIRKDVVSSFCQAVLFFSSAQEGERWLANNPGTFLMPVERAYTLAQRFNEQKFPGLALTNHE
jgi:alkylmercury lyase